MSQEKVDLYKAQKKNRKKNAEIERRKKAFWKVFGPLITLLVIALIGAGIYFIPKWTVKASKSPSADEVSTEDLLELFNSMSLSEDSLDTTGDGTVEESGTNPFE